MALPEGDPYRRLVAVAVSAVDVLHPDSDLRQVASAAGETDVLVARVDEPGAARLSLPTDARDYADDGGPADAQLPASLYLHHLDLRWRVQEADEPDLVAALSELIGFDPDDQVFCVAPATGPGGTPDPEQSAVDRAVRRVARVYGLPVLHYRRIADGTRTGVAAVAPAV
ncbi:MAG: hypothetical protein M3235_18195 [Actinomycetota bacterium]|nr:hypothetical protein [Actinomycetota bacterium]